MQRKFYYPMSLDANETKHVKVVIYIMHKNTKYTTINVRATHNFMSQNFC